MVQDHLYSPTSLHPALSGAGAGRPKSSGGSLVDCISNGHSASISGIMLDNSHHQSPLTPSASPPPPPPLLQATAPQANYKHGPRHRRTSFAAPILTLNLDKTTHHELSPKIPHTAIPSIGGASPSPSLYQLSPTAAVAMASSDSITTTTTTNPMHPALTTTAHDTAVVEETGPNTTHDETSTIVNNNTKGKRPDALSLDGLLSTNPTVAPAASVLPSASSMMLTDALQHLALKRRRSSAATTLAAMRSPCFYHQRFDDAVDIDKVLEEIKNDEFMSHSRLVQTATSVREVSKQLQRRPIKRAVRNIMIVTKARDNQLVLLTRELAGWLLRTPRYGSDLGVNVYVDAKLRNSRRFDAKGLVDENPRFDAMLKYWTPDLCWNQPEKFDLVLTLGGDGTVLFTSWLFQRIVPPVLSFSLGSLGFMTTFEYEKYKQHLNRVMGDDGMKINLRMRFTCTVRRRGAIGNVMGGQMGDDDCEQFEVLNELVIDRGPSPYVSNLELYGDDELLTVVQADGCIFSTPTGSTAYSLSAGGSLVHPDIPGILLTPICPHTLSFRPMVLSDTMALRVAIPRSSRATAYCSFDGKGRIELRQGDHVTITASQYPFPTVTRTDNEWFDSVSRTLRWNTRAASQKPFDSFGSDEEGDGTNTDGNDEDSWDIDTDSAYYASEEGSLSASPVRRQMSMLGL